MLRVLDAGRQFIPGRHRHRNEENRSDLQGSPKTCALRPLQGRKRGSGSIPVALPPAIEFVASGALQNYDAAHAPGWSLALPGRR